MEETKISDLPLEIHFKIIEKLKSKDIFKIAGVSKYWFWITNYSSIAGQITITLSQDTELALFLKTSRKIQFRLDFNHRLPSNYYRFTDNVRNIVELNFGRMYHLYVSFGTFISHLKTLPHLKRLSLREFTCRVFFVMPDDSDDPLNITSLHLENCFMDEIEITYLMSSVPKLRELTVLSPGPCAYRAVIKYLTDPTLSKSLRELTSSTSLRGILLTRHLNLEKLEFIPHENVAELLDAFLTTQTNLKVLVLPLIKPPFLTQMIRICSMTTLDRLTFDCRFDGMVHRNFGAFWNIKYLKLIGASSLIFKDLNRKSRMESLTLEYVMGDMNLITDTFEFLTNLTSFYVSVAFTTNFYVGDQLIEGIFKHLLNLRELYLSSCARNYSQITDQGIIGYPGCFPMSRLKKLQKFTLLTNTERLTDISVKHIEDMPSLKDVRITKSVNAQNSESPVFHQCKPLFI